MKKYLKSLILVMLVACLTGCGSTKESGEEEKKTDISEEKNEQTEQSGEVEKDTKEQMEEEKDIEDEMQSDVKITVYYVDDNGEIQSSTESISGLTPEGVWEAVKSQNGILGDSEMIACSVDQTEKKIDLDLDKNFGELLRGNGTTGENDLITVIVNTYLDAFECEQIKITEEGGLLSSSHKEYGTYMEKR